MLIRWLSKHNKIMLLACTFPEIGAGQAAGELVIHIHRLGVDMNIKSLPPAFFLLLPCSACPVQYLPREILPLAVQLCWISLGDAVWSVVYPVKPSSVYQGGFHRGGSRPA